MTSNEKEFLVWHIKTFVTVYKTTCRVFIVAQKAHKHGSYSLQVLASLLAQNAPGTVLLTISPDRILN